MSLRRLGRKLNVKGTPRSINRNIEIRLNKNGQKQEFHFRKGWRKIVNND